MIEAKELLFSDYKRVEIPFRFSPDVPQPKIEGAIIEIFPRAGYQEITISGIPPYGEHPNNNGLDRVIIKDERVSVQAEREFQLLTELLAAGGFKPSDLVKLVVYLFDNEEKPEFDGAFNEWVTNNGVRIARTVAEAKPPMGRVEIDGIARKGLWVPKLPTETPKDPTSFRGA